VHCAPTFDLALTLVMNGHNPDISVGAGFKPAFTLQKGAEVGHLGSCLRRNDIDCVIAARNVCERGISNVGAQNFEPLRDDTSVVRQAHHERFILCQVVFRGGLT
jgi:hypothetical protein